MEAKKSKYGKGFYVRMIILLGLLGLAGAGMIYERFVMAKNREKIVENVFGLLESTADEAIAKEKVRETIGFDATKMEEIPITKSGSLKYQVETYNLPSLSPFTKDYLTVVYDDNRLAHVFHREPFSQAAMTGHITNRQTIPRDQFKPPMIGMAGMGPAPADDDEAGDDEAGDDEAGDDEAGDDEAGDDEAAAADSDNPDGDAPADSEDADSEADDEDESGDGN